MQIKKSGSPISQQDMLLNWAFAEATSERRWRYLKHLLPSTTIQKIEQKAYASLTDSDHKALIKMILHEREPLLSGLLTIPFAWHTENLSFKHYQEISISHFPQFIKLAPSGKLIDLVKAFERGEMPPRHDEFEKHLIYLKDHFLREHMHGVPILVASYEKGPYYLIEGYTRSCAMIMRAREGKGTSDDVPVIIGVSNKLTKWFLHEHGEQIQLIPQE